MVLKFNNEPNFELSINGLSIWHSRSIAIVMIPFFTLENYIYIPIGLRSQN